jgi:hypothetical protein
MRGLAAGPVDELEHDGVVLGGDVLVGPAHQRDGGRVEVERSLGQAVLVLVGVGAVADPLEHAVLDQLAQAVGEDDPGGCGCST